MSQIQQDVNYFCYLIVRQLGEVINGGIMLIMALLLMIYGIRNYRRILRYNMSKHVTRIYMIIFLWGLFYMTKITLAILIFQLNKDEKGSSTQMHISVMSRYYFVIDILTVYILQTAIIMVPYNWVKNIIGIANQLSGFQNSGNSDTSETAKYELKVVKLLRAYRFIRLSIIVPIAYFCISQEANIQNILALIVISLLFLQIVFVLAILCVGIYSLKQNQKLTELLQAGDLKLMINQYIFLIISTIIRFVIDALFMQHTLQKFTTPQIQCSFDGEAQLNHKLYDGILVISGEGILTHFLSIVILYRIYSISEKDINPSESLLAVQPYQSQQSQVDNN